MKYDFLHLKDTKFIKAIIKLAIPISIQNFVSSASGMVNIIMLGKFGQIELAALGILDAVFFIFLSFILGINKCAMIFIAQFYGKLDYVNVRKTLLTSFLINLPLSFVFFISLFFIPNLIMSFFTCDKGVIEIGGGFLKIISITIIAQAISITLSTALKSIGKTIYPTIISILTLMINIILNYVLIYGKFGFNKHGVSGAAISTLISKGLELILILVVFKFNSNLNTTSINQIFTISSSFFKKFILTSILILSVQVLGSTGVALLNKIYSKMGTEVVAAANIAKTIENIPMFLFIGLSSACSIILGQKIGADNTYEAFVFSKRFIFISQIGAITSSLSLFLFSNLLLKQYNLSIYAHNMTKSFVLITISLLFLKVFNSIIIDGILKSGGDVKFILILNIICMWLITLPIMLTAVVFFNLMPVYVYAIASINEVIKFLLCLKRFLSKKWLNNI